MFDQAFWEERYSSAPAIWSKNPNPQLVTEVSELTPGTALDVGCGEGADARWLASRGWRVTGVDISPTALKRAAEIEPAVEWVHADLLGAWPFGGRAFDLVSAQFMHPPAEDRAVLFGRLATAVAPGGTLLIVGHHPLDLEMGVPRPPMPELFYTAEDLAAALAPGEWSQVVTDTRPRQATYDGQEYTIHDAVLVARRAQAR